MIWKISKYSGSILNKVNKKSQIIGINCGGDDDGDGGRWWWLGALSFSLWARVLACQNN